MSLLEPAQALDDVVAVVPHGGRKGTLGCGAICFLKSTALHLSVGVLWRSQIFQLSECLSGGVLSGLSVTSVTLVWC